jgi:hypothetical protein
VAVNGKLVQMLRSGVDIDGFQTMTGDQISMSAEQAERVVLSGAGDYVHS